IRPREAGRRTMRFCGVSARRLPLVGGPDVAKSLQVRRGLAWAWPCPTDDGSTMAPTRANGKICYLEIPTTDIGRSVGFYQAVLGWQTRRRGDGATTFDDGVGEVSGAWVTGRQIGRASCRVRV